MFAASVSDFDAPDTFFELLLNLKSTYTAAGAETAIVAKGAATDRHGAIDVGASKPGIQANSLDSMAKFGFQVMVVGMVPQTVLTPFLGAFRSLRRQIRTGLGLKMRGKAHLVDEVEAWE